MLDDRIFLDVFLDKLNRQKEGATLNNKDFYFTMFCFGSGPNSFLELKNRRLFNPLNIFLWKKDEGKLCYCLFSKNERLPIISEYPGWHLAGGRRTPDNLTGIYFLSTSASNFGPNMEARLYLTKDEDVFPKKVKEARIYSLRKPLNSVVLS